MRGYDAWKTDPDYDAGPVDDGLEPDPDREPDEDVDDSADWRHVERGL